MRRLFISDCICFPIHAAMWAHFEDSQPLAETERQPQHLPAGMDQKDNFYELCQPVVEMEIIDYSGERSRW